jgi:hypothetical protein
MIYKSFNLKSIAVKFGQTPGAGILLGEEGRNRIARKIRCEQSLADGTACRFAAPKIGFATIAATDASGDAETIWLARISTEGAYVRGAQGNLSSLNGTATVLMAGEGRFGAAGNTGRWADMLLTVPVGETIRVKPSRGDAYFLVFEADEVKRFSSDDWASMGQPTTLEGNYHRLG